MNIFKKISLINRILKLVKELKKHFDKNTITQEIREKVEAAINAVKDLINILPEGKQEFIEVIDIIKEFLFSKKNEK